MLDALHSAATVLADWLVETTVQVAVLAALVWVICALSGARLSARWRYALWGLVLVRLLLPVIPASPVSVHNVGGVVAQAAATGDALSPEDRHDERSDAARDGVGDAAREEPASVSDESLVLLAPASDATVGPRVVVDPVRGWPWQTIVVLVWLSGALLALGWTVFREVRFRRGLRTAARVTDPRVGAALEALLPGASLRRRVAVLRTDLVDGPALTGVLRPRVLIPGRVLDGLSDAELRHVLAHEIQHLRAGDVLQNWVMAVLGALHWFNPLVRVAFARLRVEREAVRDLAALRGESRETRQAYGRTLLRLLESGARPSVARPMAVSLLERRHDLRRRIEMIARDGSGGRRRWLVGALVTAGVVAVAMTGATSDPAVAQDDDSGRKTAEAEPGSAVLPVPTTEFGLAKVDSGVVAAADVGGRIHVERRSPPAAWEAGMNAKLGARIDVVGGRQSLAQFLATWGEAAGVNVVMHESAVDHEEVEVVVPKGSSVARAILSLVLDQTDMRFTTADGTLRVGDPWNLPLALDQRFYRVDPILDKAMASLPAGYDEDDRAEFANSFPDRMIDLIHTFTRDLTWELDGVGMMQWQGMLLIDQVPEMHARVERFLNMLLARAAPAEAVPEWRHELDRKLAKPIALDFREAQLGEVTDYLSGFAEVTVIVPSGFAEDEEVTLRIDNLPLRDAINLLARRFGLHAVPHEGVVVLSPYPPLVVRPYDVRGGLLGKDDYGGEVFDELIDVVMRSAGPRSWEELDGVVLTGWDGMLLARNTEATHAKIEEFLAAARRALAK